MLATKEKSDFRNFHEEYEYCRGILKAIFYFSTTVNDSIRLPTIKELVHKELVGAIVEYVTEKESKFLSEGMMLPHGTDKAGKIIYNWHHDADLEDHMWDHLQKQIKNAKQRLPKRIEQILIPSLEPHYERDEM